jgi:hypothetical protein
LDGFLFIHEINYVYFHEVDIIFNGKIPYDPSFDHDYKGRNLPLKGDAS